MRTARSAPTVQPRPGPAAWWRRRRVAVAGVGAPLIGTVPVFMAVMRIPADGDSRTRVAASSLTSPSPAQPRVVTPPPQDDRNVWRLSWPGHLLALGSPPVRGRPPADGNRRTEPAQSLGRPFGTDASHPVRRPGRVPTWGPADPVARRVWPRESPPALRNGHGPVAQGIRLSCGARPFPVARTGREDGIDRLRIRCHATLGCRNRGGTSSPGRSTTAQGTFSESTWKMAEPFSFVSDKAPPRWPCWTSPPTGRPCAFDKVVGINHLDRFSRDGNRVATMSGAEVRVVEVSTGRTVRKSRVPPDDDEAVRYVLLAFSA